MCLIKRHISYFNCIKSSTYKTYSLLTHVAYKALTITLMPIIDDIFDIIKIQSPHTLTSPNDVHYSVNLSYEFYFLSRPCTLSMVCKMYTIYTILTSMYILYQLRNVTQLRILSRVI